MIYHKTYIIVMAYNLIKESHRLLTYFYHLFYDVPIGFRNYSDDLIYILFHFIYISLY